MEIMKTTVLTCCSTSQSPATLDMEMMRRFVFGDHIRHCLLLHQTIKTIVSSNKNKKWIRKATQVIHLDPVEYKEVILLGDQNTQNSILTWLVVTQDCVIKIHVCFQLTPLSLGLLHHLQEPV